MLNTTVDSIKIPSKKSVYTNAANFELPSINKSLALNHQKIITQNIRIKNAFRQKIDSIIKKSNYQQMSEMQIKNEYKNLRKLIRQFNQQIGFLLQKKQYDSHNKSSHLINLSQKKQIHNKEIQNNEKILEFYKMEYSKLSKRLQFLNETPKEDIQDGILKTKQTIQDTKIQIRELMKNNLKRGNDIVDADGLIKQMKKLLKQKSLIEQKKTKILATFNKVIQDIKYYQQKSNQLNLQYLNADKVVKQIQGKEQSEKKNKKIQDDITTKYTIIQNSKKKIQSIKNFAQQKYLTKLKELDQYSSKIQSHKIKISDIQTQILKSRNMIKQLQQKYSKSSLQQIEGKQNNRVQKQKKLTQLKEQDDQQD